MKGLIGRFTGKTNSAATAKERLQLVLIHDRINLSPSVMDNLRDEIIKVISKHIAVDHDAIRIEVEKDGRRQRLVADIPLLSASTRRHR